MITCAAPFQAICSIAAHLKLVTDLSATDVPCLLGNLSWFCELVVKISSVTLAKPDSSDAPEIHDVNDIAVWR
jgi:hypothetical protein